jgi:hypothetical protein
MAVCLHCLHAARVEARERRQRSIMRFAAWTLSLAVVGVVGAAGANAVVRHPESAIATNNAKRVPVRAIPPHTDSTAISAAATPVLQQGAAVAAVIPAVDSTRPPSNPPTTLPAGPIGDSASASAAHSAAGPTPTAPAPTSPVPAAPAPATPRLGPIVAHGRTDLGDSLFAERRGETVIVHFDTSPARTRRADKFEAIVRQTLHGVYGAIADTLLAQVPDGKLAMPKELLTTLPKRGIHLTGPHGVRIALWPETRLGRDGPLVVAYRTTVEQ